MEYGKLAESIVASPIRAMMVKAAHMEDVVSFGVGEPDFITDECILKETAEHLSSCTKYAPGAGIDPLRERYIRYLNETIQYAGNYGNKRWHGSSVPCVLLPAQSWR